jgi:hypothetical protein
MRVREVSVCGLKLGVPIMVLLGGSMAHSEGLPTCRVLVVSTAASVSPQSLREVESWAHVRDRGTVVVPSIAHADVVLELSQHSFKIRNDGTPMLEWLFVARRLGEPSSEQSTYRFGFMALYDRESTRRISQRLPTILNDVCLGFLPARRSALDR